MRRSMYIPQEEQKVVLYLFALQRRQDQLRQWRLEEGHPRGFQERLERASCVSLRANSSDETSTCG